MDSASCLVQGLNLEESKPTNENSTSNEDRETLITRTFDLLKRGETEIKLCNLRRKGILFLGDTGNAKTCLAGWIAGDNTKLISKETEDDTGEFIIEDINDISRSVITSDTIFPRYLPHDKDNVAYYDTPGFNDTRDESNEVATTYFIKKVVDHVDRIKMIFVINYPSVRKGVDRHNFMKLVKHITDLIKNIEKFSNSVALIVTKVDNQYIKKGDVFISVESNKIISAIAKFLAEVKQELEANLQDSSLEERQQLEVGIKFISILLAKDGDQFSRIGIFRRPDKPGPLSEISLLQEEKKTVKRLIHENLVFSAKEHSDFGYTISEKCKNKIHYLVEDINENVWSCLCRVKDEIKEHYMKVANVIGSTVKSFVDDNTPHADLHHVKKQSMHLRDGCCNIFNLLENVRNVKNPEDLAQIIQTFVSNSNIDISRNDLLDIETKGKYFNFLQIVSDRQLSVKPWYESIEDALEFISNEEKKLQNDIDAVALKICKLIESDNQIIAEALQHQFNEKMKRMDMKEAIEVLNNDHNVMLEMTKKIKNTSSLSELLIIVCDFTRNMNMDLPENNVRNAIENEKKFIFLKSISETELDFVPSEYSYLFESVVKHLNESVRWYRFLDFLYTKFSGYELQNHREMFNVVDINDWGKTGKPQGIIITKRNFEQFLKKTAVWNIDLYENVKNITLTELQLEELNTLLNLTLKHRIDTQYKESSVIISADYISAKEIAAHLENTWINGCSILAALKSGIYKHLNIFAFNKVFIDKDIWLPGTEVRIISPNWEIIETRKICLNGADGEPHSEIKGATGINGNDGPPGKPGLPGKPGGNFFGIGESFHNGANLTVTVNGGNGGPGQHGGNGGKGKNGVDAGSLTNKDLPETGKDRITRVKGFMCEKVTCWSNFSLFQLMRKVFSLGLLNNEQNIFYRILGFPGTVGGNGGNGGKGGIGGNHGNVLIIDLKTGAKITVCKKNGSDGVGGKGGNGGMSGNNMLVRKGGNSGMSGNMLVRLKGIIRKEGINEMLEPGKAASYGQNGTSGINLGGLKNPEPSNAISEPMTIINEHERYAKSMNIKDAKITIYENNGRDGVNGSGGKGGIGGMSGNNILAMLNGIIMKEWINQMPEPGKAASNGQDGTSGINVGDLKDPEPSNAVSEPMTIIDEYKRYAEPNLRSRFNKALLLQFISLLKNIDGI